MSTQTSTLPDRPTPLHMRGSRKSIGSVVERLIELLIHLCGWSAILFVAAIFFFVLREAAPMLFGKLNHGRIDLDLGEALDRLVLEHLFCNAAVAAADDQHLPDVSVGKDRHVGHHLVVDKLIRGRDLGRAIEHQDLTEEWMLEKHEMLMLGLRLIEHPLGLIGHAETEVVEQRLGNLAFCGHDGHQKTNDGDGISVVRAPSSVACLGGSPAQNFVDVNALGFESLP